MFQNVGKEIKSIAQWFFWLEVIVSVLLAIRLWSEGILGFLGFMIIILIGLVTAYVSVVMLYAFGELVDNSTIIAKNMDSLLESKESKS